MSLRERNRSALRQISHLSQMASAASRGKCPGALARENTTRHSNTQHGRAAADDDFFNLSYGCLFSLVVACIVYPSCFFGFVTRVLATAWRSA